MFPPNLLDGERIIRGVMNTHYVDNKLSLHKECSFPDLLSWHRLAVYFDTEVVNVYGRMKLHKYCFVLENVIWSVEHVLEKWQAGNKDKDNRKLVDIR